MLQTKKKHTHKCNYEGVFSIMVIILVNGIGDPGSNPRQSSLLFTSC